MNRPSLSRRRFLGNSATLTTAYTLGTASPSAFAQTAPLMEMLNSIAFQSNWEQIPNRGYLGPELWANPWEDWRLENGRLLCTKGGGRIARNVQLLTAQLGNAADSADMSIEVQLLGNKETRSKLNPRDTFGFNVGIRFNDPIDDYRSRLLFGSGMFVGLRVNGTLEIGHCISEKSKALADAIAAGKSIHLSCSMTPNADGETYTVTLYAQVAPETDKPGPLATYHVEAKDVPAARLVGNVGVLSTISGMDQQGLVAFSDWMCCGKKFEVAPDQAFGPILWTLYTLSAKTMRMTAQMPIIGREDSQECTLEVQNGDKWKTIATAPIERVSRTATFTVENWDETKDVDYRVRWVQKYKDGTSKPYYWDGKVRRDPIEKPELTVAGFCCFMDYLFPNKNTAAQVGRQDPDIMFFMGDQIYEPVGGWGIMHEGDLDQMFTNYLRKVALLGWSFRELMRDRPTIWMPDDHDMYQGNLWGASGRQITLDEWRSKSGYANSLTVGSVGGYVQPAEWVKAVERTQTAHMPDLPTKETIQQGLTSYYTSLTYGRIGFAVLEDRKFKSGPMSVLKHNGHRPDWITDREVALAADVPDAQLLGQQQLDFLTRWSQDWKGQDMKMVVSQTVFANAATHHGESDHFLVADLDSNGWPQSGRKRALETIRKGHAFMLGGDQHLPTIIRHGIQSQGDAGVSFVVPAGATGYQRWWRPEEIDEMECLTKRHDDRPNTGLYRDGFGNLIDILAVSNPPLKLQAKQRPALGHEKVAGWGMVRMNREKGTAALEAWYADADIDQPDKGQMPGWPQTFTVADFAGSENPTLPTITLSDEIAALPYRPVVQVTDAKGNVVSTVRMQGRSWAPVVFDPDAGPFTVTLLLPEENNRVILRQTDVSAKKN